MKHKLNPYLSFEGNCAEAFALYEKAFGGKTEFQYYREANLPIEAVYKDAVMHARLVVGEVHLMGSDYAPGVDVPFVRGNNFAICIYPETLEDCERLMSVLGEEGDIVMPFAQQFFGYFGQLTDRFGVSWMVFFETDAQQEA